MSRTIILIALVAACGGKAKSEDTTVADNSGGGGGDDTASSGGNPNDSAGMCSPEMLQDIQADLDRKRETATRCLTKAMDAGAVDKNTTGQVALVFVIGTDGKAKNIQVTKSTIENKDVQDCVEKVVAGITFPNVPKDLDYSYTYGFEAF